MADKAKIQRSGKAKWTVMVYMAGDNNLDGAALRDIEEMARVGSTKDVNCLVQIDRLEDRKTRRFLITKGGGYKPGLPGDLRRDEHRRSQGTGRFPFVVRGAIPSRAVFPDPLESRQRLVGGGRKPGSGPENF